MRVTRVPDARGGWTTRSTIALGLLLALSGGIGTARARSIDEVHAEVCRCSRCRDAAKCCCVRGAEATTPPASPREKATEVEIARRDCDSPGSSVIPTGHVDERPMLAKSRRSSPVAVARGLVTRDEAVPRPARGDRLDRPPR